MGKHAIVVVCSSLVFAATVALVNGASTQYMAICTEKAEHGGQEYGVTAWLNSLDAANAAGKRHEQETKGHRWRVEERNMP